MRGCLLGHSVGLGVLGKRGSVTPCSRRQRIPLLQPLQRGKCHAFPQEGCRHWQSALCQHRPTNPCWTRPTTSPGGQGRFFGAFSTFSAASHAPQAAGRRRLAAALISAVIFTLKRLCNRVPCPSVNLSTKEAPGEQSPPRPRGTSLMLFQLPTAALQEPRLISARKASVPAALKSAFPGGEGDILPR